MLYIRALLDRIEAVDGRSIHTYSIRCGLPRIPENIIEALILALEVRFDPKYNKFNDSCDPVEFLQWLGEPTGGGSEVRPRHVINWARTILLEEDGPAFWCVVKQEWASFDLIPHRAYEEEFHRFRHFRPHTNIRNPLKIYRGGCLTNVGLAWTTSIDVAREFLVGHRGISQHKQPALLEYIAQPEEIAFTLDDREGAETVLMNIPTKFKVLELKEVEKANYD